MANTYSKIFIQIVFAVKGREILIKSEWENNLYKYVTGIIQNKGQKLLAINGMPDHIHIFIGMKPTAAFLTLCEKVKKATNEWINENNSTPGKFSWQEGFGAFSYSHSQIDSVVKYILDQKNHHRKKTFREEYLDFLKEYEIDFNEKYLFDWMD